MPPSPFAQNLFLRTGNRCGSFMSKIVRGNHRWDHAWSFNKTEDTVVFLRSIWGICVTSFYIPAFFFFFFISSVKKIRTTGCVSNGENFRIAHLFFFSSFFFSFDVWNMNCIGMDGRYEWIIDVRFYYLKVINEKIICSYCSCYLWNYTIVFLWFQSFAMNFNIFILITICYKNFILCQ